MVKLEYYSLGILKQCTSVVDIFSCLSLDSNSIRYLYQM